CDRVRAHCENNGDRRSSIFGRACRGRSNCYDNVDSVANKAGGQCWQAIVSSFGPSVFDSYILPLDIAGFAQPLTEGGDLIFKRPGRCKVEVANHGFARLLTPSDERRSDETESENDREPDPAHGAPRWRMPGGSLDNMEGPA